jgi:hypothetical protein
VVGGLDSDWLLQPRGEEEHDDYPTATTDGDHPPPDGRSSRPTMVEETSAIRRGVEIRYRLADLIRRRH